MDQREDWQLLRPGMLISWERARARPIVNATPLPSSPCEAEVNGQQEDCGRTAVGSLVGVKRR